MLGTHIIAPERMWGAPADGGCWAQLAELRGAVATDRETVFCAFSRAVRSAATAAMQGEERRVLSVASAVAAYTAGDEARRAAKLDVLTRAPGRWRTHAIAATLVHRLARAYSELERCASGENEDDREAFLWKMYAASHMDLAVELATARTAADMSDAALCARPRPAWPSRYELAYPWGTRCHWAGYAPRLTHIVQSLPWLAKSQTNKKQPLRHTIQKAYPGKGVARKWDKLIAGYCAISGEVALATAAVVRCGVFGSYPDAGGEYPAPSVALRLWHALVRDPAKAAADLSRERPKLVLCAWQEFIVWILRALEPLNTVVSRTCDLDKFCAEVCERATACVRGELAAAGPGDEAAGAALSAAEDRTRRSYSQLQCSDARPTNRPSFSSLFVRAVNTRIRDKEMGAPREVCTRALRPVGGVTVSAGASEIGIVAPWRCTVQCIDDAMELAKLPGGVVSTICWLRELYEAREVTDNNVKASVNRALSSADIACLRAMRACLASMAFSNVLSFVPLSMATLAAQLAVVPSEKRFAFVCPSCCALGATYLAMNRRTNKFETCRGLKFVSYGIASDCVLCNKQVKAPRSSLRNTGYDVGRIINVGTVSDARSKTSCGARMITVPVVGFILIIKGSMYASCEECGVLAELDGQRWCTGGRILCRTHACEQQQKGVSVSAAPPPPRSQPCVICSKAPTKATASAMSLVRVYFDQGTKRDVSLSQCCRRHYAELLGPDGRIPELLRASDLCAEDMAHFAEKNLRMGTYRRRWEGARHFAKRSRATAQGLFDVPVVPSTSRRPSSGKRQRQPSMRPPPRKRSRPEAAPCRPLLLSPHSHHHHHAGCKHMRRREADLAVAAATQRQQHPRPDPMARAMKNIRQKLAGVRMGVM